MDDLYHTDLYAWSQRQADVLRGMAGRRDLPNDLDLANVAEEIESVGGSELSSVSSYLRLMLVHLIKIASVPEADSVQHWGEEVANFHAELTSRFTPSMAQNIDLDAIWDRALAQAKGALAPYGQTVSTAMPRTCPLVLSTFLTREFDLGGALAALRADEPGQTGL